MFHGRPANENRYVLRPLWSSATQRSGRYLVCREPRSAAAQPGRGHQPGPCPTQRDCPSARHSRHSRYSRQPIARRLPRLDHSAIRSHDGRYAPALFQ